MRSAVISGFAILAGVIAPALAGDLVVALASTTSPVHPGGTVTLVIRAEAGAVCEGRRQGHFGNAYSIALPSQTAGADGLVRWQWRVLSGNHPVGIRGVHITCAAADRRGALDTSFDVE
jgi:hypothetical protein